MISNFNLALKKTLPTPLFVCLVTYTDNIVSGGAGYGFSGYAGPELIDLGKSS